MQACAAFTVDCCAVALDVSFPYMYSASCAAPKMCVYFVQHAPHLTCNMCLQGLSWTSHNS